MTEISQASEQEKERDSRFKRRPGTRKDQGRMKTGMRCCGWDRKR